MREGWVVSGSPGELSADSGVDSVLVVVLGSEVGSLVVSGLQTVEAWHESVHLKVGDLVDIADVPHGLQLLQMAQEVHEVQHEVVLVGSFEGLHLLSAVANEGDGRLHGVLRLHKAVVLGLDLLHYVRGVKLALPLAPVDGLVNS